MMRPHTPEWTDRWTGKTLWIALDEAVQRYGDREAFVFVNGRVTYRELQRQAEAVARGFLSLGIGRGDRVAIWMAGYSEWAYLYFGLTRIGAVMVPLNTRYKPAELEYVLKKSRTRALVFRDEAVSGKDYSATLMNLCPELSGDSLGDPRSVALPELRNVITIGSRPSVGGLNFDDLLAAGRSVSDEDLRGVERQVSGDDVAMIQFTSGTTAFPKGALLFQLGMLRGGTFSSEALGLTEGDRFFSPQPFYHCGGSIHVMLSPLVTGCVAVVQPYFDAGEALRMMEAEECNATMGHQPHWIEYLNHPDRSRRKIVLRKAFVFATPDVNRLVQDEMGVTEITSTYGMTETHLAGTACSLDAPLEVRLSTVGQPPAGMEMEIRDPASGRVLPLGQAGEICFRGWGVMKGYYDDPELTAQALDPDNWFHTGDVGLVGDDGNLRLIGRIKEMIRVGGENVAAVEVESYLLQHPAVKQAVVVGRPDSRLVEVCVAFVELKAEMPASEQEIIDFCRAGLASFKVPREVRFVTEWPMSGTGKIQKFLLKEDLASV